MSLLENVLAGSLSSGSSNAGAGLPTSGEGTSLGLRVRPTASSATSAPNPASVTMMRLAELMEGASAPASSRRDGASCHVPGPAGGRDAIAPVAGGEQPAQRHQQASAPDPVDEGLVVHTHQPCGCAHRFAQRDIQVARKSGV